jgi:hypothetical protein
MMGYCQSRSKKGKKAKQMNTKWRYEREKRQERKQKKKGISFYVIIFFLNSLDGVSETSRGLETRRRSDAVDQQESFAVFHVLKLR